MEFFTKLKTKFKELFFQNYTCDLCGKEIKKGERFCHFCREILPYNIAICSRCGRKYTPRGLCPDCKGKEVYFAKARSLYSFEGAGATLIYAFKNGSPYLADTFAEEGKELFLREISDCELITFIPSSKKSLTRRGYNQAELLARALGKTCNIELIDALTKKKENEEQKGLTEKERKENVKGAFFVTKRKAVRDKVVVLCDDVLTTGTTTQTATKLLLSAGAKKVYVFTVASVQSKRLVKTEK